MLERAITRPTEPLTRPGCSEHSLLDFVNTDQLDLI